MKYRALLAGLFLFACEASTSAQIQIDWSSQRDEALKLAAKLPKVDTENVNCPPFDAEVRINLAEGAYVIHIQFRRPDRIVALMRDMADGSPAVLYRDKTVSYFDAVAPQFVVLANHRVEFYLKPGRNGRIDCGGKVGHGPDALGSIQIDVAGLMQLPKGKLRDCGSTKRVIRLEQRREKEKREEVELRLDQEPPVCVWKSWTSTDPEPAVELTLRLHTTESRPLFQMPDVSSIKSILPVTQPDDGADDGVLAAAARMKRIAECGFATVVHFGVWHPETRGDLELPGLLRPDWSAIRRNKVEIGPGLRLACGLPPLSPDSGTDSQPFTPQMAADEPSQAVK